MRRLFLIVVLFQSFIAKGKEIPIVIGDNKPLYAGISNGLRLVGNNYNNRNLIIETDNGVVERNGEYITLYPRVSGTATLKLRLIKSKQDTITISSQHFRVDTVPLPKVTLGGISSGKMSKSQIVVQLGIAAERKEPLIEVRYVVTQFRLTVIRKGEIILSEFVSDYLFPESLKGKLKATLTSNDYVIVSDVKVKCSTTQETLDLEPIIIGVE